MDYESFITMSQISLRQFRTELSYKKKKNLILIIVEKRVKHFCRLRSFLNSYEISRSSKPDKRIVFVISKSDESDGQVGSYLKSIGNATNHSPERPRIFFENIIR